MKRGHDVGHLVIPVGARHAPEGVRRQPLGQLRAQVTLIDAVGEHSTLVTTLINPAVRRVCLMVRTRVVPLGQVLTPVLLRQLLLDVRAKPVGQAVATELLLVTVHPVGQVRTPTLLWQRLPVVRA